MSASTSFSASTSGNPLIASDRVEGTDVYSASGDSIGSLKRLMIEKVSGKVSYAVVAFGGFMGLGADEYTVPWGKLNYDTSLGGYRTDITEAQLKDSPSFYRDSDYQWRDRDRERELHDYWMVPYYWGGM